MLEFSYKKDFGFSVIDTVQSHLNNLKRNENWIYKNFMFDEESPQVLKTNIYYEYLLFSSLYNLSSQKPMKPESKKKQLSSIPEVKERLDDFRDKNKDNIEFYTKTKDILGRSRDYPANKDNIAGVLGMDEIVCSTFVGANKSFKKIKNYLAFQIKEDNKNENIFYRVTEKLTKRGSIARDIVFYKALVDYGHDNDGSYQKKLEELLGAMPTIDNVVKQTKRAIKKPVIKDSIVDVLDPYVKIYNKLLCSKGFESEFQQESEHLILSSSDTVSIPISNNDDKEDDIPDSDPKFNIGSSIFLPSSLMIL